MTHPSPAAAPSAPEGGSGGSSQGIVRSEEQLRVRTVTVPTGVVRVHKRVVTEEQTVTVQVRREELVIEQVDTADRSGAVGVDHAIGSTPPLVVVLHGERPVVTTEVVPLERVSVHVDVVTDQQTVGAELRHEEIELIETPGGR